MTRTCTLVMTDIVDSTRINERIGDVAMRALWQQHDARARELMRHWRGLEIGRGDGFLVMFETPADAVGYVMDYHRALSQLEVPLEARAGVHRGAITLRRNSDDDVARGATPFEIDGMALPIVARLVATCRGGQTLTTEATLLLLPRQGLRVESHGHWRLKGLDQPLELFEVADLDATIIAPPDSPKAYRVVRRGEVWATLEELPNNLPGERGPFVGRLDILGQLGRLFDDGARLVTLLGIGGVGKTRVALAYARAWLGDFPGGAWFCDLNAARGLDGIVYSMTQSLGLPATGDDPVRQIGAAIAGRGPCLVILDTFEQVARLAEPTIGRWLARAPHARFLVTSREVLGIPGEQALVMPPMPDDEARALFRLHLRAIGLPTLADVDELAIDPLMRLLDNLPLAIELAAARARVMAPSQMLHRMGQRFKLLVRRGERHDRQNTLRATLDWSWDLLDADEQRCIMQLAVFEGRIGLESAEAVVRPGLPGESIWVPDLMQGLVEKSLLRVTGTGRFELLRAVQDYAWERLVAAGLEGEAQARHWRWFAGLREAQAVEHRGEDAENLVAACRRAIAAEDREAAVALLRNAWAVLRRTGPFNTGRELAQALATILPPEDPRHASADAFLGAASMLLGDFATARRLYLAAAGRAIDAADAVTLAFVRCQLAQLELACGDAEAAERALEGVEATGLVDVDGDLRLSVLNNRGLAAIHGGRWNAARELFSAALATAEQSADDHWLGGLHGNLAMVARAQGHRDEARRHWLTALKFNEEAGDRQWEGNNECNLGLLLHEMGEQQEAMRRLQAALARARAIGHLRLEATVLCNLGLVHDASGDQIEACSHYAKAADVAASLGDRRLEGQARGYLGLATSGLGRHEDAWTELVHARTLLEPLGDPSTLAIVLAQSASAACAAGDLERARTVLGQARACVAGMAEAAEEEATRAIAAAERAISGVRAVEPSIVSDHRVDIAGQ